MGQLLLHLNDYVLRIIKYLQAKTIGRYAVILHQVHTDHNLIHETFRQLVYQVFVQNSRFHRFHGHFISRKFSHLTSVSHPHYVLARADIYQSWMLY